VIISECVQLIPLRTRKRVPSLMLSKNVKIRIRRTANLSVVTYGCETWSLTFREGRKMILNIITGKSHFSFYNILLLQSTELSIKQPQSNLKRKTVIRSRP
jgi:hypothetical protein